MEFNDIAILLTENCNARCKMCCDSRGLVKGKTLSIDELDIILHNISQCNEIDVIGITGGEPMLYPKLIKYITDYDYGRKVSVTIKTNGFWGYNRSKAEDFIKENKNKVSFISLSYDGFHKEFIPIESIRNIIELCAQYGINTDVVGCFLNDGIQPGDILNELGDSGYYTKFCYQPVIQTGSAKHFEEEKLVKLLNTEKIEIRCIGVINPDILINPYLQVFPCCSQVIENTILNFGNLAKNTLSDIINSIKHNKVMFTLFTEGFRPFINFMKEREIAYPQDLASPCELCAYLFENDWFLKELSKNGFYQYI